MDLEKIVTTGDIEGTKIEREKKYIIDSQKTAQLIAENFPDDLLMTLDDNPDEAIKDMLREMIPQLKTESEVLIKKATNVVKHRPNFYFDTQEGTLHKNNIYVNLREREVDWNITIKIRPHFEKSQLIERIEVNSNINPEAVTSAKDGDSMNIEYLINRTPYIKSFFNERIRDILKSKPLIISNSYVIDSTSSDYVFGDNGKITISMDEIKLKGESENHLYEMEIEIEFGLNKSWLDTISMRVFDYLCSAIIKAIKSRLRGKIDLEILAEVFERTTMLSKIERVRAVPEKPEISEPASVSENILYTSLEGKGHAISFLIDFLSKIIFLPQIKKSMPIILCSYLISITRTYSDVKPIMKDENTVDLKNFRESLKKEFLAKLAGVIDKVRYNHELIFEPSETEAGQPKMIILKLTESNYIINFLIPSTDLSFHIQKDKEVQYFRAFTLSNKIMNNFFTKVREEFRDRKIFEEVQVDSALIYDKVEVDMKEGNPTLKKVSLIYIDSQSSEIKQKLKYKIINSEIRLNYLIKKRYHLKKDGYKEPLISMSDERNTFFFMNLFTEKIVHYKKI